jgi:hypothetical protein
LRAKKMSLSNSSTAFARHMSSATSPMGPGFSSWVTRQHKKWPEKREPKFVWYAPAEAMKLLADRPLQLTVRKFVKQQ